MSRRSVRVTNGSIGWVDSIRCSSLNDIFNDLLITMNEWNLYVCQEKDCRHAFVVHKDFIRECYYFYDYQGSDILEDKSFCTTQLYHALKHDKSHRFKVKLGQINCIISEEYANLCMKNSAFVMKYHCAPKDKNFNSSYHNSFINQTKVVDLTK